MTQREKDLNELRQILEKAAKVPWQERFEKYIKLGIIDRQGRYIGPLKVTDEDQFAG